MAKKDFDIDFDFDEAYGFDAKSFSDDAAFDDNADAVGFSDEELGLASDETVSDGDDFDLDGDLDDFLNMGNDEDAQNVQGWMESEQDDWQDEENLEQDGEIPGQYAGEEGYDEETAYDEDAPAGFEGESDEAYDGEGEEYNTHAANPLHHRAPDLYTVAHVLDRVEYRRAGGGEKRQPHLPGGAGGLYRGWERRGEAGGDTGSGRTDRAQLG